MPQQSRAFMGKFSKLLSSPDLTDRGLPDADRVRVHGLASGTPPVGVPIKPEVTPLTGAVCAQVLEKVGSFGHGERKGYGGVSAVAV